MWKKGLTDVDTDHDVDGHGVFQTPDSCLGQVRTHCYVHGPDECSRRARADLVCLTERSSWVAATPDLQTQYAGGLPSLVRPEAFVIIADLLREIMADWPRMGAA